MSFPYNVALVQFREPGRNRVPEGIRYLGVETEAAEEARREENGRKSPMTVLVERNGASLVHAMARLAREGLALSHAYAQQRYTIETEHKGSKPYTLTTFVFLSGGQAANGPLVEMFEVAARRRYEYVKASEGTSDAGEAMLCLSAKTTANRAAELKYLDDAEADTYGIAVSKAVRKEDRKPTASPSAPAPRRALPPSAEVRPLAPAPVPKPQQPESEDPQLDRLKAAGWEVDTEKTPEPGKVFLFRVNASGKRGELTHHCPKKIGPPQRKRA